jgi:hypothetical protein
VDRKKIDLATWPAAIRRFMETRSDWLGARGKLSREEIARAGGGVKYRENTDGKRRHARKDAPFWPPFAKHPVLPSEDRVVLEGLFYGFGKV